MDKNICGILHFPRKIKLIKSKEVINDTLTCLIHIIKNINSTYKLIH
jgi:hypothetical protein